MSKDSALRVISRRDLLLTTTIALTAATSGCDFDPTATAIAKRLAPSNNVPHYAGIIYLPPGASLNELTRDAKGNLVPGKSVDNAKPKYVDRAWILSHRVSGLTTFAFVDSQSRGPGGIFLATQDPQVSSPNNEALFYTVSDGEIINTAAQASRKGFDVMKNVVLTVRERPGNEKTKIARLPWETSEIYLTHSVNGKASARRMALVMS